MLSLFVSSFSKNRICCWCNSVSLDRFAEDFKKHSLNELISLKIRSLISAIICNLRFSSSTLKFKAPSKFDWMNVLLRNVSTVAWLVSSISWLDCTVAWLQSTDFWPDVNLSLTCKVSLGRDKHSRFPILFLLMDCFCTKISNKLLKTSFLMTPSTESFAKLRTSSFPHFYFHVLVFVLMRLLAFRVKHVWSFWRHRGR